MGVNRCKREVAICAPLNLCLRLAANIPGVAPLSGTYQVYSVPIYAVLEAVSPEEIPVRREAHVFGKVQFERRMEIHEVGRADQARFAEIRPPREQRVEGLEIRVVGIPVAAGDVCRKADPRTKKR